MTTLQIQVYLARIHDFEEPDADSINGIFTTIEQAKKVLGDFASTAFEDYKKPLSFTEWQLDPDEDDVFRCFVSDADHDNVGYLRIDQIPLDGLVAIDNNF